MDDFTDLSANGCIVQEGLFLYTRNASPYEGGIFHQVRDSILEAPNLASIRLLTLSFRSRLFSCLSSPSCLREAHLRW